MDKHVLINALIAKRLKESDKLIENKLGTVDSVVETMVSKYFDEFDIYDSLEVLLQNLRKDFSTKLDVSADDLAAEFKEYIEGSSQQLANELIEKYSSAIEAIEVPKPLVKGVDYNDGINGEDYVLTSDDMKEIAELVKIELPEVENKTAEEIRDMLETLKGDERLDIEHIKGLSDKLSKLDKAADVIVGGKTNYLKDLRDVDLSGLTIVDGKYVFGSGGVSDHSELNLDDGTNPHGTVASDVGLGNVDNTSDLDKPISTATESALGLKADVTYVDTAVASLVDSAPGTLDTLNELADALGDDPNFAATTASAIAGKANAVHVHAISEVTNLQAELDGKVDDSQVLTNVPSGAVFTDTLYDDTAILSSLSTKADTNHTHTKSDITDFNEADYATAAQGDLADTALQASDITGLVPYSGATQDVELGSNDLDARTLNANDVNSKTTGSASVVRSNRTDGSVAALGSGLNGSFFAWDETKEMSFGEAPRTMIESNSFNLPHKYIETNDGDLQVRPKEDGIFYVDGSAEINEHTKTRSLQIETDVTPQIGQVWVATDALGNGEWQDKPTSLITNSGRFYMYTNNRWITDSDDNYGTNYYQFTEGGGTAVNPVIEWEHMGFFVPKGKKIKKLHFTCRTNSAEVTDVEIYGFLRHPNPITVWETGMDADGEDTVVDLFREFFVSDAPIALAGNMVDRRRRTFTADIEVPEDSYLSIYVKPVGTITATRYLTASYTWEIE